MKKIVFVLLLLCIINLSSCEVVEIEKQRVTPTSLPISGDEIDETIYDELEPGERDKLLSALDRVGSKLLTTPSFVIFAEVDTTTMGPGYGLSSYTTTDFECDLENLFVFYHVKENGFKTADIGFMNTRDGKIIEYTLNSDGSTKEEIISEDTSSDSVMSALSDYGLFEDSNMDYIGNVVQLSEREFEAEVAFHRTDEFMGVAFRNTFKNFEGVDYNTLRMYLTYTFNEDFTGYTLNIKFDIDGETDGVHIHFTMDMNQTYTVTEFEQRSLADLGFRIPVSETIEDIRFNGTTSLGMNFQIYANKDNWIRYYLEPGYYETAISRYELNGWQIYNEDMEPVYSGYPFEVLEGGYFYVNLQTGRDELFNFFILDLGITDISIETINGIEPGSISGYSEGKKDYNRIIVPSKNVDYILLIEIDLTDSTIPLHEFDLGANTQRGYSAPYCNRDLKCSFLVDKTEDLEIWVWTDEEVGNYTMTYRFVEVKPTTSNMYDALDISNYNAENPVQLGRGVDHAYFTVTIEEYGKYQINTGGIYGMGSYIEYDLYTMDGTKLELGGMNGDYIEAGTYYIDMYYDYGERFDVMFPVLIRRD